MGLNALAQKMHSDSNRSELDRITHGSATQGQTKQFTGPRDEPRTPEDEMPESYNLQRDHQHFD